MLDFAIFAKGRADETDRITAVALNFEMKGKRFAFNGYRISILTSQNQAQNINCMATNEIKNGCGSSIEAVLASNQKRRRVLWSGWKDRLLDNALRRRGRRTPGPRLQPATRSDIDATGKDHEVTDRHVPRPRQHEEHRISDLFGLHQAARGERIVHLRLRPIIEQRRYDRTRGHRADPDAVLRELTTERVDEGLHREFGGGVNRLPHDRDDARDGTGEDNVARFLRDHVRQHSVDRAEGGVDVQVQHPIPLVRISGQHVAADVGAGVGMEDVEAAGKFKDFRQQRGNLQRLQQIHDQWQGVWPQFRTELREPVLRTVYQNDLRAFRNQCARALQADTRCRTCDGGNLSLHGFIHLLLSWIDGI